MKLLSLLLLLTSVSHSAVLSMSQSDFKNHTSSEISKNRAAILKISEVQKGECFKKFMLSRKLIQTNGLTNSQVIDKLNTTPVKLELQMYNKFWSNVNGYTYSNTNKIWLNRKYHNSYGVCSVANNLAHEISHKQGFGHDYKSSTARQFSVPYSINAAFSACCVD